MNLSSPNAVNALLKRFNLHAKRRFGQNFLVDANTLNKIVQSGSLSEGSRVLEIGAGLGVLTSKLADAVTTAGRVVSIEIDRNLLPVLAETVGSLPQVRVVSADALTLDWHEFIPKYLGPERASVIANIPYNITSPLIASMLECQELFRVLVFLVQKEVAVRLAAGAGSPDYGAFSVFVQYHASVEIVGIVGRKVFYPPPDVDSAIIRLTPRETPPVDVRDKQMLFAVVRASFGQRRKSLLNALSGDPSLGWDRETAANALTIADIDPGRRGETLSMEEFARIANTTYPS